MEHQSSRSRGFGVGRGRCSSDPDPLQRGPCLHSWPSACAALSDLGPPFEAAHPPEGSGWMGVWGSLARCVPPVTGTAWPSAGRGSSCLCTRAEWLAPCWHSGLCAASALPAPHLCALPGCCGVPTPPRPQVGSDRCPSRFPPTAPAPPGGQRVSFQPLLLSPWLPWALLCVLFKFLTKLLLLCFNC